METTNYTIKQKKCSKHGVFTVGGNCYKQIRQANTFLANAKPIAANGTHVDVLTEEELIEMKANVRFMRALLSLSFV